MRLVTSSADNCSLVPDTVVSIFIIIIITKPVHKLVPILIQILFIILNK